MKFDEAKFSQFVDDQIGLDVNTFSIDNDGAFIRIRARIYNNISIKSKSMEEEWRDTAVAAIAFLEREGYGTYALDTVSGNHCQLEKIEKLNHEYR